ncbi:pentapeptide repeat-containing protein [Oscillatoriales cyanobacterium LEGE 11467]|uniref:Pentapeptide repeat-containing protein n=1 Tax=Zarconia navalis LEGE 11467 TaxID=1828826 RepID=A0A928Z842_9CYAN|nr:pentapeptide repeat-containing protein [Zarconia navalis]MBE9040149.1 pentapeptide repeat-containing protein [Zarconia navalis LEGE 11467]
MVANEEHLSLLKQGVPVWNQWRKQHKKIRPDLRGVDLRGTDLRKANLSHSILFKANFFGADLQGASLDRAVLFGTNFGRANLIQTSLTNTDLFGADFTGAKLKRANLRKADLTEADFTEADLTGASLVDVQAIAANFEGATLTGACVSDWNINETTHLKDIVCEWIYLDSVITPAGKIRFRERQPQDAQKNFAPGEFIVLFQSSAEIVELIFSDGIEWTAFLDTFQQLERELKHPKILIQAFEKKSDLTFVIRLQVPEDYDREEIDRYFNKEYNLRLKTLDRATQKQSNTSEKTMNQDKREQCADLLEIAQILAKYQHSRAK